MTTIQNPALRVTANVARFAVVTTLGLAGAALLVLAMSSTAGPSDVISALPSWTLTTYFIALGAYITAVAVTSARENARDAEKAQFDIR